MTIQKTIWDVSSVLNQIKNRLTLIALNCKFIGYEQGLNILFNQLKTNKSLTDDSRPVELLHIVSEVN